MAHKTCCRRYCRALAEAAGAEDPDAIFDQWMLLTEGATITVLVDGDRAAATKHALGRTLCSGLCRRPPDVWAAEADLRPVFQAVQVPTLFLERADADTIDPKSVRAAAALTPQGRYVEIPGDDLLPFLGDPEPILGEIEEFLTGARGSVDPDRTLSTVLFTDIVGSTEKADRVGDREWRNILDSHHSAVRASLDRYGGVEIDTAGDGFLATFSGPARAVRCACDIRDTVRDLGLEIRAGLHTGEVERRQDSVSGLAVHVGARVAAQASAGEVLVTSIVKALVLGSGLSFADRGTHSLKGVPDTWQLFAAM